MGTVISTGGPAFPVNEQLGRTEVCGSHVTMHPHIPRHDGMTLRDYFAAKAMQGILACESDSDMSASDCAIFAYAQADEMLKARDK